MEVVVLWLHRPILPYFTFEETTAPPVPVLPHWEDETFYEENKLAPHAVFMPYANTAALRADAARYAKPWLDPTGAEWQTLNGVWKLNWVNAPTDVTVKNVQIHYAEGMGILAQLCTDIRLDGSGICLRGKDDPRYFTTQADATHFSGCAIC